MRNERYALQNDPMVERRNLINEPADAAEADAMNKRIFARLGGWGTLRECFSEELLSWLAEPLPGFVIASRNQPGVGDNVAKKG